MLRKNVADKCKPIQVYVPAKAHAAIKRLALEHGGMSKMTRDAYVIAYPELNALLNTFSDSVAKSVSDRTSS